MKLFQKIAEEKILPYLFLEAAITLILRSDKTITQEKKKKKNYRPISLTNRGKSPQKKKKKTQQTESNNTLKGSYTNIKWDLSQGCKDFFQYSPISMIHINKLKNKNYMMISIKAEKPFDKIQHALMIKFSRKFMIKVPPERKSTST